MFEPPPTPRSSHTVSNLPQVLTPDLTWHDFDYEAAENPCVDVLCKPHASCFNVDGTYSLPMRSFSGILQIPISNPVFSPSQVNVIATRAGWPRGGNACPTSSVKISGARKTRYAGLAAATAAWVSWLITTSAFLTPARVSSVLTTPSATPSSVHAAVSRRSRSTALRVSLRYVRQGYLHIGESGESGEGMPGLVQTPQHFVTSLVFASPSPVSHSRAALASHAARTPSVRRGSAIAPSATTPRSTPALKVSVFRELCEALPPTEMFCRLTSAGSLCRT
jgi:hypothetical protein